MIKRTVREIVGEVRYALATRLRDQHPRPDGKNGFSHTAEGYLVGGLSGVELGALTADYYIAPGDGAGPIIVEVGDVKQDKWAGLKAKDGQPVRVLLIGLDGHMRLEFPRRTPFEQDLLRALEHI